MFFFYTFTQIPSHGLAHLPERLLLFRHDYESQNILQLLNAVSDVTDETLIEIILNSSRKLKKKLFASKNTSNSAQKT